MQFLSNGITNPLKSHPLPAMPKTAVACYLSGQPEACTGARQAHPHPSILA